MQRGRWWKGAGLFLSLGIGAALLYLKVTQDVTPAMVLDELAYQLGPARRRPAPPPPPTADRLYGGWPQDMDYLVSELPRLHANAFHTVGREQWIAQAQALKDAVRMSDDQMLKLDLMELMASIGDGHTSLRVGPEEFSPLPVKLRWFAGQLYVVAARFEGVPALGQQVVAIGGAPVPNVERMMLRLTPHENAWNGHLGVTWRLTSAAAQARFGLKVGELTVIDQSGRRTTLQLKPLAPTLYTSEEWDTVPHPPVLADEQPQALFWFKRLSQREVYLRYRLCDDPEGFQALARDLLTELDRAFGQRQLLVIDLRGNPGGGSAVMRPLLQGLKARPPVKVHVLTDGFTYSSALMNTVQLKRLGAVVYGDPPGENLTSYGEVRSLTLPNTGLVVQYATRLFRFAPEYGHGLLKPDIPVTQNFDEYTRGIDPVLNAALKGWQAAP